MTLPKLAAGPALGGALPSRYAAVRAASLALAAPLSAEDCQVQSMPDASPTKWHLAHITWFFETFVLRDHVLGYTPFDERYAFLFNSYYDAEGPRHARPRRGMLSRPSLEEVRKYRAHVDEALERALPHAGAPTVTVEDFLVSDDIAYVSGRLSYSVTLPGGASEVRAGPFAAALRREWVTDWRVRSWVAPHALPPDGPS